MPRTEDSHLAQLSTPAGSPADPVEAALPEPAPAIPVRDEAPALAVARCVTLSASNPVKLALPQDPRRRSAVLLAVDNDVYIAASKELGEEAANSGGATSEYAFYLPAGIGIPVVSKAALWAAVTTTSTSSRLSVLINKDDQ